MVGGEENTVLVGSISSFVLLSPERIKCYFLPDLLSQSSPTCSQEARAIKPGVLSIEVICHPIDDCQPVIHNGFIFDGVVRIGASVQ